MGLVCCVKQCKNTSRKANKAVSFHALPPENNGPLRKKWLSALQLTEAEVHYKYPKVCSVHFQASQIRQAGQHRKVRKNAVPSLMPIQNISANEALVHNLDMNRKSESSDTGSELTEEQFDGPISDVHNELIMALKAEIDLLQEKLQKSERRRTFLEVKYKLLKEETINKQTTDAVNKQVDGDLTFSINHFMENDSKFLYYTGMPNYQLFQSLLNFVLPSGNTGELPLFSLKKRKNKVKHKKLSGEEQLFMVLLRLRKGVELEFLSDLFGVCTSTAHKIFSCWINLLYVKLGSLNVWPHRDLLIKNAPTEFKIKYPNVIGSIDCTEFFCQTPSSLLRQSQCYSNYKSATTLKALIMIEANGAIIFCSQLMTGSMSDKQIVIDSGFAATVERKIKNGELLPGDIILADKGFKVQNLFRNESVNINIPSFRVSGMQFSADEVEETRYIAQERIHVERAIGRLKKFKLLRNVIPISLVGTINQIHTVCCMLTNFRHQLRKK